MNPYANTKEIFSSALAEDLEPIVLLLAEHDIDGQIVAPGTRYLPTMTFDKDPDSVRLLVDEAHFDEAMALLVEHGYLENPDPDAGLRMMLGDLDNDELMELIADARRQPADQVAMARKLLTERGVDPDSTESQAKVEQIVAEEREPKRLSGLARGFLIFFALGAAPLGLAACLIIVFFTGTDAHGEKYYLYSQRDRTLAKIVGAIGIGLFFIVTFCLEFILHLTLR